MKVLYGEEARRSLRELGLDEEFSSLTISFVSSEKSTKEQQPVEETPRDSSEEPSET